MNNSILTAIIIILCMPSTGLGYIATFEDLTMQNEQTYMGPGGGRYWSGLMPDPDDSVTSTFETGGVSFWNTNNECCGGITYWNGFAYSNTTDSVTPGFDNQYSAFPGSGVDGSANYGIAYDAGARLEFARPTLLEGAYFTNTTYAALAIRDGAAPPFGGVKRFGGASGDDEDFFKLVIIGEDPGGDPVGAVSFMLADYTFGNNALDYVVTDWVFVDLSPLGTVSALSFDFQSTDIFVTSSGEFINTPLYFAIDNLTTVPLPAALWLFAPLVAVVVTMRRRGA